MKWIAVAGIILGLTSSAYADCGFVFIPCPEMPEPFTGTEFLADAVCAKKDFSGEQDRLDHIRLCKELRQKVADEAKAKTLALPIGGWNAPNLKPTVQEQLDQINKKLDAIQKQ